ncbi:MAG: hypothetical protein ISN28_11715 [Ectothiorhodospiraceae bacterium AqS1]|nr:hypothetical protein [Ectothiorhodospiraceae bacterium AqS1]
MIEEITVKSLLSKHFGMSAIALAILATSFIGQVDEERIVGIEERIGSIEERVGSIEKEIVEIKVEVAGLKEDVNRIEASQLRLESKIDAFIASQVAAGGRAGG